MINTIRLNCFETNSSSMHAITVCEPVEDKAYVLSEIERWKQQDGSYKIVIELDENKLDNASFTTRHYIPHFSLNDKLIYVFATICQHYNSMQHNSPRYPCKFYHKKDFDEKVKEWEVEFKKWKRKGFYKHNLEVIKDFEKEIISLEDHLAYKIKSLFGNEPNYEWTIDKNGVERYLPVEPDTRPNVSVTFEYKISEDTSILPNNEDEWFSTGCYGNEEFYASCCTSYWDTVEWLFNPYNAILAGGDEMDDEEYVKQRRQAKKLIDESFEKYKENSSNNEWQLIMNEGKVIWPIGG